MTTEVIQARGREAARAGRRGARALQAGKLVGFATETVYGVAAAADSPEALQRLRDLKGRPDRPFSVHVGRVEDVGKYVRDLPAQARWLISRAWPGPITILVPTGGQLADAGHQAAGYHQVLCHDGMIGLRCPATPAAQAMLAAVEAPVVATSANLAGKPSPRNADETLQAVGGGIDLLLDSGPTRYGRDSTIVRFAPEGWDIVRPGICDREMIRELVQRTLLFVCTGNTCRSPIAQGLAIRALAERLGCSDAELARRGVTIVSAGVYAFDGGRANALAIQAARELGVDISAHRSRRLTTQLINAADLIFCMTGTHVAEVSRMVPSAAAKARGLCDDGDVSDPIVGGLNLYRRTAQRIKDALTERLDREQI